MFYHFLSSSATVWPVGSLFLEYSFSGVTILRPNPDFAWNPWALARVDLEESNGLLLYFLES